MSLLNKASLIQIPSGYKDGTLYSAKPTNGDGDFTFSRGSNLAATRVNSEGLIEKGRENLLLQSNSFSTSPWTGTATWTSGQADKDGGTNAWNFAKSGDSSSDYYNDTTINGVQTFSIYAKKQTGAGLKPYFFGSSNGYATFNLEDGSVYSTSGSIIIDTNVETYNSQWWRISVTINGSSGNWYLYVTDGTDTQTTDVITLQDAQLEQGLVATDYIETTTTTAQAGILEDMPRLDYSGGATCPSLLLEPQRSNVLTQSEYFDGSYFTKNGASVSQNEIVSPEGVQNASELTEDTSTGNHEITRSITNVVSTSYSISVFAKANTRNWIRLSSGDGGFVYFNLSTGEVGIETNATGNIVPFANDWYRCEISFTANGTNGSATIRIAESDGVTSYTGESKSVYLYGFQYEEGSYATSYIPTYGSGSSVTRGRDGIYNTNAVGILNDSQGSMYLEIKGLADGGDSRRFTISDGGTSNRVILELDEDAGRFRAFISSGGTTIGSLNKSGDDQLENKKIVVTYNNTSFKMFINGVLEDSVSISQTPIGLDSIFFANSNNTTFHTYGRVSQAIIFPTALTDAECIQLTTI